MPTYIIFSLNFICDSQVYNQVTISLRTSSTFPDEINEV